MVMAATASEFSSAATTPSNSSKKRRLSVLPSGHSALGNWLTTSGEEKAFTSKKYRGRRIHRVAATPPTSSTRRMRRWACSRVIT